MSITYEMMTVEECANALGCNPKTVRESIENKTFKFGMMLRSAGGKKIYKISKAAFERWYKGEEDIK